ncbi:MAG: hypothetical protein ACI4JV_10285 [Ruminiclostridium sp.]
MNTNEFYKELMNEYSFDYEKIRKAAMGKSVQAKKSRLKAVWLSVAGAAAAIAITFSSVALLNTGSPVSVAPTTSVSAEDRFRMAMEAYNKAEENTEDVFLYVTFRDTVTPEEMQSILAKADSKGNIRVTEVYLTDGTKVKGSEDITALFDENAKDITAVKVYCPGNFLRKFTALRDVYLVETEDSFSEDDFSAIDTSSDYNYYPDYSTSDATVTPDPVPGDSTDVPEQ